MICGQPDLEAKILWLLLKSQKSVLNAPHEFGKVCRLDRKYGPLGIRFQSPIALTAYVAVVSRSLFVCAPREDGRNECSRRTIAPTVARSAVLEFLRLSSNQQYFEASDWMQDSAARSGGYSEGNASAVVVQRAVQVCFRAESLGSDGECLLPFSA